MPARRRVTREAVTPQRIYQAALRLIDEGDMPALTMRRLASELQVEATALYHHVANKEAILAGVADLLFAQLPAVYDEGSWDERVRAMMAGLYELVLLHPFAVDLIAKGVLYSEEARAGLERLLSALREGGFDNQQTVTVAHSLRSLLVGFGLAAAWGRQLASPAGSGGAPSPSAYPLLNELGPELARWNARGEFETGLDVLLDGFALRFLDGA
jgi:AcrR family transcriptional regulator